MRPFLLLALSLLTLSACKTYSDNDLKTFDEQIQAYIKKNKLDLEASPSGLYYKEIVKGEGKLIQYGDKVSISYKGKLLSGQAFDYQKKPIEFEVRGLIAGWKEALLSSRKGSELLLIIPPQLGYGDRKLDNIPPNSILYYELKVVDIK